MKAVYARPIAVKPSGGRVVDALIVANTTPTELPTTGAGITGLTAQDTFAPFSLLYVVADVDAKVYVADESGQFVAQ